MKKQKKNESICMMAVGGRASTTGSDFKRYIGVGTVKVVAINPTKDELNKLTGRELENEIDYLGKDEELDCKTARIDIWLKLEPELNNGIESFEKHSIFIKKSARYNKDNTKIQVINKYGQTMWALIEDFKSKNWSDLPTWFENADIRPTFIGEEELISLIKVYLNIPSVSWKDGKGVVKYIANREDAEAQLENYNKYFEGNFKELQELVKLFPDNIFKACFGVKLTDDGKEYQTIYGKMFLKPSVKTYTALEKSINDSKDAGGFATTEFSVNPIHEYSVTPTTFGGTQGSEGGKTPPPLDLFAD